MNAIGKAPEVALQFEKHHGRDVVDELIHQSVQRSGISFRKLALSTLANFSDPRVAPHMKKILFSESAPELVELAMVRLSQEPDKCADEGIKQLLLQDNSPMHVHAAATLLLGAPELTDSERLRVSLANEDGVDVGPELNSVTVVLMIRELHGWFAPQARRLIEERGEEAFLLIRDRWPALSSATRGWLLRLGARKYPISVLESIRFALQEEDTEVLLQALLAIEDLGQTGTLFAHLLEPLLSHPGEGIRAQAIRAGAPVKDLETLLSEADDRVVSAAAYRLALTRDLGHLEALCHLLAHESSDVRGAATEAIQLYGREAIPHAREFVASADLGSKVAATRILMACGDHEWLEEHLIDSS
jgi:hypothetical protein